jgi:NAD(P)-dependent dehydrogenase (short-subunit alcohol dehydrogenase family)
MSLPVALITGASTGIGLETALALASHGYRVYAGVRNMDNTPTMLALAEERGCKENVRPVKMDVLNVNETTLAIQRIMTEESRIDVLINNAGQGMVRSFEQASMKEIHDLFDLNFMGNIRTLRQVVPIMREQGGGRIIAVSSVGGLVGQPMNEVYCASKFAIEGLYESMATYFKPYFNIDITIIEPGAVATEFVNTVMKNVQATGGFKDDAYKPVLDDYLRTRQERASSGASQTQTPADIAKVILRCVQDPAPPLRTRTSDGGEQFCALKTSADPDGTTLQQQIRSQMLGK